MEILGNIITALVTIIGAYLVHKAKLRSLELKNQNDKANTAIRLEEVYINAVRGIQESSDREIERLNKRVDDLELELKDQRVLYSTLDSQNFEKDRSLRIALEDAQALRALIITKDNIIKVLEAEAIELSRVVDKCDDETRRLKELLERQGDHNKN